jgi:hypothetical protein
MARSKGLSVTLSVGTPLCPYGIAYRRTYGLFRRRLFKKHLCSQLCVLRGARFHIEKERETPPSMSASKSKHVGQSGIPGVLRTLALVPECTTEEPSTSGTTASRIVRADFVVWGAHTSAGTTPPPTFFWPFPVVKIWGG